MKKLRAIITAEIGKKGYRQFPVSTIEAATVESQIDTDADQFSVDIGDGQLDLSFLIDRDNEVRASIFSGEGKSKIEHLHTGIADIVSFSSDDHVISIAGRDMSSIAVDSQAPPGEWKGVRPAQFVTKEARELGFSKLRLADVTKIDKFYRDGSESYWEGWYRMYRHKKMWMWTEANGTLVADKLQYASSPLYRLGAPKRGGGGNWIPVESCQITKDNQQRVGSVWVFGERGDLGFVAKAVDNSMQSWIKRPRKILLSSTAKNVTDAKEEAWEELFESKVGALEISVTVALSSTGQMLQQNQMAEVNIPDIGLAGIFYIVGSQLQMSTGGYTQKIRLREKNYALSRRDPQDPKLAETAVDTVPGSVGTILRNANVRWANTFASAAMEFHGGWDYNLWLGVLLSIARKEASFLNVREGGDQEWFPAPPKGEAAGHRDNFNEWERQFANDPGNPLNPFGRDAGVGPMQLTTHAYKVWADEYGGKSDELSGGRWVPQANIRAGARAFAGKLAGLDPGNSSLIWEGVRRYNGTGAAAANYRDAVKAIYNTYYKDVTTDVAANGQQIGPSNAKTDYTVNDDGGKPFNVQIPDVAPAKIKSVVNVLLQQLGKPYQWAAEGPASFDCSGLVNFAYHTVGLEVGGRSTYNMFRDNDADPIKKDQLRTGDVIFFEPSLGHCGVYLNDGHFIHAPHTGDVVKISSLAVGWYTENYHGPARRIITWPSNFKGGT